ncbi:MAG TPA: nuclear transport factor 2 family protein [Streptosporangiaceae bacterium]|nr:nuclear transport factor 2 family protein [Streptosporangiaceae bacterium]
MPWFPEFTTAVELARRQARAAGQADPVAQYLAALTEKDTHALHAAWPGEIVIYDPKAGVIHGRRELRQFVRQNKTWLAGLHARIETFSSTCVPGRAVVELLAHLTRDGQDQGWPIAVVAESTGPRSVVFRTYCSQWPVDGRHHLRPPILQPGGTRPGDVVGRYLDAVQAGDAEAAAGAFTPDGHVRESIGPDAIHRGRAELRSFFAGRFGAGGGLPLEVCAVTDDGARCAVEFNIARWGRHDLPPQAGIVVCERGPGGLLASARLYEDIDPPAADA